VTTTAMRTDEAVFAYNDITNDGRQAVDWQTEELIAGADMLTPLRRIRYRIHHGTYHPAQSYAVAHFWSPVTLSWNEIATCLAGTWAGQNGYADGWVTHGRNVPTIGMHVAMATLRKRASDILAVI
jgi:hypothetical protein